MGISTPVHGDDFISSGDPQNLTKLEANLNGRFEIKTTTIGNGSGMTKEGRVLNRVLSITEEVREYEPDQRHAELIIEDMHLNDANAVTTPGE